MKAWRTAMVAAILAAVALAAAALVIRAGIYDISATRQHVAPVYWVLNQIKIWSVRSHAAGLVAPDLSDPALIASGERAYHRACTQCHGAPGIPPDEVGLGVTPVPPNLAQTALDWSAAQIFWVTRHGIKSTGMPGWDFRMSDEEIWEVTAFVKTLPDIVPAEHRRRHASPPPAPAALEPAPAPTAGAAGAGPGDPDRGRHAMHQYACTACHRVPGVPGPDTLVGPPLDGAARRAYIAGILPNTPGNMARWLQDPVAVDPLTAMPGLGVTPQHARDMVAYLDSLEDESPR